MRILTILALFASAVFTNQVIAQETTKVDVIKFTWQMRRQQNDPLLLPFNTNSGSRPIGKIVQPQSSDLAAVEQMLIKTGAPAPSKFYLYELKVKNSDTKTIKSLLWEYQAGSQSASQNVFTRQFLCTEKIKANDSKTLKTISFLPPVSVVDASDLKDKDQRKYVMDIIINRVEYTDGTIWQRTGWDFSKIKSLDSPEINDTLKFNDCALL